MPIKPENKGRYSSEWKAIRASILARADLACEWPLCAARNYDVGLWEFDGASGEMIWRRLNGVRVGSYRDAREVAKIIGGKLAIIVLTIAHLDHAPENNDPDNLRALCQRHHLAHDHEMHMRNSRATRRARRAVGDLFESA